MEEHAGRAPDGAVKADFAVWLFLKTPGVEASSGPRMQSSEFLKMLAAQNQSSPGTIRHRC